MTPLRRLLVGAGRLLGRYRAYMEHATACEHCAGDRRCDEGRRIWRGFLDAR
ncbi:hypothetical protein ACFYYH_05155 [Streptomyces sp. NPDC002018]|uniref:hypothetical protein n=1 Tax=Streptomyces sp. NPDC002018 TaxID=3364629 RepID=UPI0036C3FFE2